jgi:hypothetical protein
MIIEKEPLLQLAKEFQGNIFGAPLIVQAIENAPEVNTPIEVIKEFAQRLETALLIGGIYPSFVKSTIRNIVEEMEKNITQFKGE